MKLGEGSKKNKPLVIKERNFLLAKLLLFGRILGLSKNSKKKGSFLSVLRFAFGVFLIICLVTGFAPIRYFIGTVRGLSSVTKTINLYAVSSEGDWLSVDMAQGEPNVCSLCGRDDFSEANSAIYKGGNSHIILRNFVRADGEKIQEDNIQEDNSLMIAPGEENSPTTSEGLLLENTTTDSIFSTGSEDITEEPFSTEGNKEEQELEEFNNDESFATGSEDSIEDPDLTEDTIKESDNQELDIEMDETQEETTSHDLESEDLDIINEELISESSSQTIEEGEAQGDLESGEEISFFGKIKKSFASLNVLARDEEELKSVKVKLSLSVERNLTIERSLPEEQLQPEESTLEEEIFPEMEEVSFWNRFKNFFGDSVTQAQEIIGNSQRASVSGNDEEKDVEISGIELVKEYDLNASSGENILEEPFVSTDVEERATVSEPIIDDSKSIVSAWYSLDGEMWWKLDDISIYPISNALNGGYFEYDISFLKNWKDIENLRIKIEGKTEDVIVHLDSAWVEITYQTWSEEEQRQTEVESLITPEGEKINFIYTDDNLDENLIIKSNKKSYHGLTQADVYFSVTNIGRSSELFDIQFYLDGNKGAIEIIERWEDNKWQELELLNGPLLIKERGLIDKVLGREIKKKAVPGRFQARRSTNGKKSLIRPGQTQYFKMKINFPPGSKGEFYIEAVGDKEGYGLLDPWWDSDWLYKKPITINYSGSSLSDFQILVTADTESLISSKMQTDCGDIRMIDSNEGAGDELDYWIEPGTCNTTSTRIWVEVPSITGNKTIYMYYGKADAPNGSSGSDTFVYFNDFETSVGFDAGALNPSTSTASVKYGTYGIEGAGAGAYRQETRNNINSGRDLIWETWIQGLSSSSNCSLSGIGIGHPHGGTDRNGYQAYIDERNAVGIRYNFQSNQILCSDNVSVDWNTWYFLRFYWTSDNELGMSIRENPASDPFGSCTTTNSNYTDGEYGVAAYKNAYWDNYRVRKYAPTEPTTEVGLETENVKVTVDSFGDQISSMVIPSTNQHVGGGFSITEGDSSRNITGITITEYGTVDAQTDLDNIKLYYDLDSSSPYDCASEQYDAGSDSQFGSTSTFSGTNGTSTFTGSVGISTSTTMCVYVVLDVGSGATNGETLKIKINDPSSEVSVSSGQVGPNETVEISGTTNLQIPSDLQQTYYRWRNDDASETGNDPPWWNSSWDYRKKVSVASGTSAGTNYQVSFVVGESSGASSYDFHLEGHCQDDFDDIRFTDGDGTTLLDYWVEETTGSTPNQTSTVWVEVQDDLDSPQDIYIYYGNGSVASAASGTATFMFFDDFNDGDDSDWTEHNGSWNIVSNEYYQSSDDEDYLRTSNGSSSWVDYILETKIKIASGGSTGGFSGVLFRMQDIDNHYAVILDDRPDDSFWIREWVDGSYSQFIKDTSITVDRDTWYDLKVSVADEGTDDTRIKVYIDGDYKNEYLDSPDRYDDGKIALMMHGTQAYYDDIRVRKYASTEPDFSSVESEETIGSGASFTLDENASTTDLAKGTLVRVRFLISNEGGQVATSVQYRLEVSDSNPASCASSSYERVSTDADWEIIDSDNITDGQSTYNIDPGLTDPGGKSFVSGELKDAGDQTDGITLTGSQFTEIEYSIRATDSASNGASYCFRLTDDGSTSNFTYSEYAEAQLAIGIQVSNVSLNGGADINLVEGTTKSVSATSTVTNDNADFSSVIGRIYRSGVSSAEACTLNNNNCYEDAACATSSCSGSDCVATCDFDVWFHAEPTDAGSDWESEHWVSWIKVIDSTNASSTATNSVQIVEMNTLLALEVSDTIDYGVMFPNQTNDPLDKLFLATTTGNAAIDANISGTNMFLSNSDWYSSDWLYRKQLTIDHNEVDDDLTNFPVLVSTTSNFLKHTSHSGKVGNDDGTDILFTQSNGTTKIPHEMEYYASTTGELIAWVKSNLSSSTDTNIYMYYGNSGASDQQQATSTWDDNYIHVWHMDGSGNVIDSVDGGDDGTNNGSDSITGKIGKARDLVKNNNDYIDFGDMSQPSNDSLDTVTFEWWISIDATSSSNFILSKYDNAPEPDQHSYENRASSGGKVWTRVYSATAWPEKYTTQETDNQELYIDTWAHVVRAIDLNSGDPNIDIYVDGSEVSSNRTTQTLNASVFLDVAADDELGSYRGEGGTSYSDFKIDEIRISKIKRSSEWIAASYSNQSSPSGFLSFGEEETPDCIPVEKQHYATSSIAYDSGYVASSTAVLLEFGSTKPTSHPSTATQDIYWGINVPDNTPIGNYSGVNTFSAQSE